MQNNKKAVVTGASGFLGFVLTKRLIEEGFSVYAVVRPNSAKLPRLERYLASLPAENQSLLHIVPLDLNDIVRLPSFIPEPCDLFYHLGWNGGVKVDTDQDLNILTSATALLSAVKLGCSRFIASGSQAEYGLHNEKITECSELRPITSYGEAKVAAYFLTKTLAEKHGIQHIWTRIFSVYGPNENSDTLIHSCISSLLAGNSFDVTPCEQIWNFLYEDDLADALLALGTSPDVKGVYNVANPDSKTLLEYLSVLHDTVKQYKTDAKEINFGARPYGFNQIMHLEPDVSKFKHDTGCQSKITFPQGVENTLKSLLGSIS